MQSHNLRDGWPGLGPGFFTPEARIVTDTLQYWPMCLDEAHVAHQGRTAHPQALAVSQQEAIAVRLSAVHQDGVGHADLLGLIQHQYMREDIGVHEEVLHLNVLAPSRDGEHSLVGKLGFGGGKDQFGGRSGPLEDQIFTPVNAQGGIEVMQARQQADTAALRRHPVDGRLNVFAGPDHDGTAMNRRPMLTAVVDLSRLGAVAPGDESQTGIMMVDAPGWGVLQLFHGAIRGAGRKHPVVADFEAAIQRLSAEGHPDPVSQVDGALCRGEQSLRVHVQLLVPAPHPGMAVGVGGIEDKLRENGRAESEFAVGLVDLGDVGQVAGLLLELQVIVQDFDPVTHLKTQHLVPAQLGHRHLVPPRGNGVHLHRHRGRHRAVILRPLEFGDPHWTGDMYLHAVEAVFQAPVTPGRADNTGGLIASRRLGRSTEAAGGGSYLIVPGGNGLIAAMRSDIFQNSHLPHGLPPGGGVRTAQSDFLNVRVFEGRYFPLPDIQIAQIGAPANIRQRRAGQAWRERTGIIRLVLIGRGGGAPELLESVLEPLGGASVILRQQTVHVDAAYTDGEGPWPGGGDTEGIRRGVRHHRGAQDVESFGPPPAVVDFQQFVPVSVQADPALLLENPPIVFMRVKGKA